MSTQPHDRDYLTDAQIAEMLAVPVATVAWWRRAVGLPYVKAGRHPRVRRADLDAFLAARTVPRPEACR